MTQAWLGALSRILDQGQRVAPRGKLTLEVPQLTLECHARCPVVALSERNLQDKFLAGEAYWILSGDNRVDTIAPYNSRIAQFSDDGETFFGAYGPRIQSQLDYVVDKLLDDPTTRQAGLTIWIENPPETKDVPCTVAIFFGWRGDKLNAHVFMRSSDAWLGLPYDVFNFSMLIHLVCCRLNARLLKQAIAEKTLRRFVEPGKVYLTAASSHLYEEHWEKARDCLRAVGGGHAPETPCTPGFAFEDEPRLMDTLRRARTETHSRWWRV